MKVTMTCEQVLRGLALSEDELGHRIPYRQLNALAAKQSILDEPQLCALAILAVDRIPGTGCCWVVDVDRKADVEIKWATHVEATNKALEHRW